MNNRHEHRNAGFTLVEMAVALVLFTVVIGSIYSIYVRGEKSQQIGIELAEATQNARSGVDLIARELRSAGYGVNPSTQPAIVTGSQYRVTFALDMNGNRQIDMGEVITYFLDSNTSDALVASSPNPYDFVLRRKVGTAGDSLAAPVSGSGEIVAYGLTQRSNTTVTVKDVPLFSYRSATGIALELKAGTANDAAGVFYGKTVSDPDLGKPPGPGTTSAVKTVLVNMVTETKGKNVNTGSYDRVSVATAVEPRNFPFLAEANLAYAANTGATGTGTGTGTASGTGTGSGSGSGSGTGTASGTGTGTGTGLPPSQPPIHLSTDRVLSMIVTDLNELDASEGSNTLVNGQHDLDIVVGTKAGGVANIRVWWNGQPGKYTGSVYYKSTQSYMGNASYDVASLASANLDNSSYWAKDIVAGCITGANTGMTQVWKNQAFGNAGEIPGQVGLPGSPTTPNAAYYDSPGTGEVNAVALGDLNRDGSPDIVSGQKTGANTGRLGVWWGSWDGTYSHSSFSDVYVTSGEVRSVAIVDMNGDGWLDIVAGTKRNTADTQGNVDIFFSNQAAAPRFTTVYTVAVGGSVYAIGTALMDGDDRADVVTAIRTGTSSGKVEFWHGNGTMSGALTKEDDAVTVGPALSLALGPLVYGRSTNDIVVGTAGAGGGNPPAVQAFFCDPSASLGNIIPAAQSWADANAGGSVNAVAIGRLECSQDRLDDDPVADIVAGTSTGASTGDIVIYLNPYSATVYP